jgi:segregation and condensation protein B
LTRAALECLAVVAYKQPVTRSEVESVRGVESGPILKSLLEKRLVRILGRKEEPGRPMIYGTTRDFLQLFGLKDLTALPTLRDLQELVDLGDESTSSRRRGSSGQVSSGERGVGTAAELETGATPSLPPASVTPQEEEG